MLTVNYKIEDQIAYVGMNRPEKRNSMSSQLVDELVATLLKLDKDNDVRVIILYGEGKAFSAGGDIDTFRNYTTVDQFVAYMETTYQLIDTIKNLNKWVVAAVHGFAAGAGFSLAMASDFIVASEDTKFICSFTNVGLIPDLGLIPSLQTRISPVIAKEWIVTGRTITASEAKEFSLLNRLVAGNLIEEATAFANTLIKSPPLANKFVKYLVEHGNEFTSKSAAFQENIIQALLLQSADNKEGIQAFIEKRKPEFVGK